MYFLIFQPEDMLKLCLNFNESQPVYAYKRYAHIFFTIKREIHFL